MEYNEFLKAKEKKVILSGFDIEESSLNNKLFDLDISNGCVESCEVF